MSHKVDVPYLRHVLEATGAIEVFARGKTFDDFRKDDYFQSAVIRKLEIIGEAVAHISKELKVQAVEIPWQPIVAARNRLIHGYFAIDEEKTWDMVQIDIPVLQKQIVAVLEEMEKEKG